MYPCHRWKSQGISLSGVDIPTTMWYDKGVIYTLVRKVMLFMYFTLIVLAFAALGLLLGLARGWKKSTVRLAFVVVALLLSLALAPAIAETCLDYPIEESGMTLQELVEQSLMSDATVGQLMEASPTLYSFILQAPKALVSLVLFVALFFVLKLVLLIPGVIINAIFCRNKSGSRLIGAVIGALQGVLCACVLLTPLMGIMPATDVAVALLFPTSTLETFSEDDDMIFDEDESFGSSTSPSYIMTGLQSLKSDPCYTILHPLAEGMTTKLTTFQNKDGTSSSFIDDVRETIGVVVDIAKLSDIQLDNMTDEDNAALDAAIASLSDARLLSHVLSEVITNGADTLRRGETFLTLQLPDDLDDNTSAFFGDILDTLAESDQDALITDLWNVVEVIGTMSQCGVLEAMTSGSAEDITALLQDEDNVQAILYAMSSSYILSPITVSAVNNYGMSTIAKTMEVPANQKTAHSNLASVVLGYMQRSASKEERVAMIQSALMDNATGLSEANAITASNTLVDTYDGLTADKESVSAATVVTWMDGLGIPALSSKTFKTLQIISSDLYIQNTDIFRQMNDTQRAEEAQRLAAVIAKTMQLTEALDSGLDLEEQWDILPQVGQLLNMMGNSTLLGNSSTKLMLHFLSMDAISSVMAPKAIQTARTKISQGTLDYESLFSSVAAAYRMAKAVDISSSASSSTTDTEELKKAVENLVTSLDRETVEIVRDTVDEKFLEDMGVPEEINSTASVVMDSYFSAVADIVDAEGIDIEKESAAVETMLGMIADVSSSTTETEGKSILTDEMLDTILDSEIITTTLVSTSQSEEVQQEIGDLLSDADRNAIAEVLNNYESSAETSEKLSDCADALRLLFGIK